MIECIDTCPVWYLTLDILISCEFGYQFLEMIFWCFFFLSKGINIVSTLMDYSLANISTNIILFIMFILKGLEAWYITKGHIIELSCYIVVCFLIRWDVSVIVWGFWWIRVFVISFLRKMLFHTAVLHNHHTSVGRVFICLQTMTLSITHIRCESLFL